MAFDKTIEHNKEKRKPYMKRCEQVDPSCRPHGGCEYCKANRLRKANLNEEIWKQEIEMWEEE